MPRLWWKDSRRLYEYNELGLIQYLIVNSTHLVYYHKEFNYGGKQK